MNYRKQDDNAPSFNVARPVQNLSARVGDFRTFRVKNRSQRHIFKISLNVVEIEKKVRSQLKKTDSNNLDSTSILAFLKEISDACSSICIHEGVATCLFSYFTKKPASSSLEPHLLRTRRHVTELHDDQLLSYIKVFIYLLATFAAVNNFAIAIKELEMYKQGHDVLAASYAKHLYAKALHCETAYEEKRVKLLFVKSLASMCATTCACIWDSSREHRSRNQQGMLIH